MPPYSCRGQLRPFACRRCLAQAWLLGRPASSTWACFRLTNAAPRDRTRSYSSGPSTDSSLDGNGAHGRGSERSFAGPVRPIRERLREFVAAELPIVPRPIPRDAARAGATQNALTRVESHTLAEIDADATGSNADSDPDQLFQWQSSIGEDPDSVVSPLARPYGAMTPKAGDLIEVSTDSWRVQLLAVCLGNFRGVDHFYTNTGKWFATSGVRTLFGVTKFASPEELAPVIAALPSLVKEEAHGEGSDGEAKPDVIELDAMLNTLQEMKQGPSREAGAGLLKRMHTFAQQSASIHMAHATVLDNAFGLIRKAVYPPPAPTHVTKPQLPPGSSLGYSAEESAALYRKAYFTLEELAGILFHPMRDASLGSRKVHMNHKNIHPLRNFKDVTHSNDHMDEFTAPAMYAIYRALISDDLSFRPLTTNLGNTNEVDDTTAVAESAKLHSRSRSCLFSVSRPEDVDIVRTVESIVRRFNDDCDLVPLNGQPRDPADTPSRLAAFIVSARNIIDYSRETRSWSPYGMLLSSASKQSAAQMAKSWQPQQPKDWNQKQQFNRAQKSSQKSQPSQQLPLRYAGPDPHWYPFDVYILHFMHLWAGFQRFSPSSRLHWIGSSILRATQRYEDSEYLTMSTGWTFLQELGWLQPWDIPARYSMSLPDVPPLRNGQLNRSLYLLEAAGTPTSYPYLPPPLSDSLSEDIFAGKRKDWGELTAYCIDAPDAEDIDDGVALERIENNPDEFWIHVHVADPASCIRPGTPLADMAARLPQTAYLPGYNTRMFPDDIVRKRFSLGPDQPCLTFSARVNRQGTVLESKITPARLGSVVFITPGEVSSVVAGAEEKAMRDYNVTAVAEPSALDLPWTTASFSVGTPPSERDKKFASILAKCRHMTTADELTPDQKADLETLSSLATALRGVRLANGAMPLYWPRPSVEVSMINTAVLRAESSSDAPSPPIEKLPDSIASWPGSRTAPIYECHGDPYIRIWYEGYTGDNASSPVSSAAGSRLVESTMRLAGEVAANWCHERDIAVPFRGQPDAVRHLDRLKTLARDDIYPMLVSGKRPPEAALLEFRRLLGADDITSVSVPHVTMGAARYTKATSPLRRYSDLLVHWQIEGALLAEMNGSSENSEPAAEEKGAGTGAGGPPFTRAQMEHDILPLLRVRERSLRMLDNKVGRDQWILQAMVRAWKGEDAHEIGKIVGAEGGPVPNGKDKSKKKGKHQRKEPFSDLRFTVTRVNTRQGLVTGRLDWFERVALMEVAGLNPLPPCSTSDKGGVGSDGNDYGNNCEKLDPIVLDDVRPGQVYPVALDFVDVHANRVLVRRTGQQL